MNDNFRNRLITKYLLLLNKNDYKETFVDQFELLEPYINYIASGKQKATKEEILDIQKVIKARKKLALQNRM